MKIVDCLIFETCECVLPQHCLNLLQNVPNFERLVVFRWGQLHKTLGPGMFVLSCDVDLKFCMAAQR